MLFGASLICKLRVYSNTVTSITLPLSLKEGPRLLVKSKVLRVNKSYAGFLWILYELSRVQSEKNIMALQMRGVEFNGKIWLLG
jgi:hypothetical protein